MEEKKNQAERVDRNASEREAERVRREREAIAEIAGEPPEEQEKKKHG